MGLSYAQALASAGANIAALDSSPPDQSLNDIAAAYGVNVFFHKLDVTNPVEVNAVISEVEEELGSIDIWYFLFATERADGSSQQYYGPRDRDGIALPHSDGLQCQARGSD